MTGCHGAVPSTPDRDSWHPHLGPHAATPQGEADRRKAPAEVGQNPIDYPIGTPVGSYKVT